ncbi:MAG: ABC transporter ATP-binding protein [Bacteroidales bacterium]
MSMLSVRELSRRFGEFRLDGISFDVTEGEYFVLLGMSGSGKTKLLELLAGLEYPDTGNIIIDGVDKTRTKPQDRNIGLVFQDFAVFPHMTTFDNIAYPLRIRDVPDNEIMERVTAMARRMNIVSILNRRAVNLSGGELQRTALARTLAVSPRLLLLDEPLASIDASLKDDITRLLRSLNRAGQTIIHVTHDFTEAIGMASRVGVIHDGRLIQTGTPAEVFDHPVNRFVARYTGIRNFFRARFRKEAGAWMATTEKGLIIRLNEADYPEEGMLVIRSRRVKILTDRDNTNSLNLFTGKVAELVPTPSGTDIEILAGERIFASVNSGENLPEDMREGSDIMFLMDPVDLIFVKKTESGGSD